MKIILKSPSTLIGIALIAGIALAFLFSFVNIFVVVSNATSDIARSIGYELRIVMNITNTSTNELDINDMNSLRDFVIVFN